jgi:hypothetical protein
VNTSAWNLPDVTKYKLGDTVTDPSGNRYIAAATGWDLCTTQVLAQSGVAINTPADTNEDILVAIPLPVMQPTGSLCLYTQWSATNNANAKTARLRLGTGTATAMGTTTPYGFLAMASNVGASIITSICNRGVQNSQVGYSMGAYDSGVSHSSGKVTSTVDLSVAGANFLYITGQKATAGDTLTLENYQLEWLPA